MKLLTRYLLKDLIHYFLLFLTVFVVILLVYETYDTREEFIELAPSLADVVMFLIYSLPGQLAEVLPIIGFLASVMTFGLLAKNREILAMVAAGISFRHLAVPALIFGLALTAFVYVVNESIVPAANSRAHYIEKVVIGGKSEAVFTKRENLFVKGVGNRFYYMQEYFANERVMLYPTILELAENGNDLSERIEAVLGLLVTADGEGEAARYWQFIGAERWEFDDAGSVQTYQIYDGPYMVEMEEKLDRFLSRSKRPEQMNLAELTEYVGLLARKGGERIDQYRTAIHLKLAFPITSLFMVLLGFAVVADVHARHFARGVFIGLLLAIGYYLVEATLSSLGEEGAMVPFLAGWSALLLLALVSLGLMQNLDKIRG